MNKNFNVVVITIFFINIVLCGCFGNKLEDRFIGTWETDSG
jgi:hypothetical protein